MQFKLRKVTNPHQVYNRSNMFSKPWWNDGEMVVYRVTRGECYSILVDNIFIGFIIFRIVEKGNHQLELIVEYIEFTKRFKNKGYFPLLIEYLFSITEGNKKIQSIVGESITESISKWNSIGANFNLSEKRLKECVENGYTARLRLTRSTFFKNFYKNL